VVLEQQHPGNRGGQQDEREGGEKALGIHGVSIIA
jgi:hypothetical protein